MKKELKRRIITVIVGAVIMCMVSLVPEMVQAYASTNAVSEDAGIRAEYNGDSGVLTLDVSTNKAMIDFGLEDKKPWTNFNVIKVVVKPGVTHIGNNAFSGCTNLESVVIEGDEPLTIGRRAFLWMYFFKVCGIFERNFVGGGVCICQMFKFEECRHVWISDIRTWSVCIWRVL